jgi:putative acetyltransferase
VSAGDFVLRALAPTDMPGLTDLWVAAWRATGLAIDFEARREWFATHLEELAAGGADIIVAEGADGRLAGFMTIDRESGYLDQLCVAPARQGGALARVLLDAARTRARGRVRLEVNADNARACRFYRREGFVETGRGVSPASGLPILRMEWRGG